MPVSRPLRLLLITGANAPDAAPLLEELCWAGFDPEWRTLAWPVDACDFAAAISRFREPLDLVLLSGRTPIGPAVIGCVALLAEQSLGLPLLVISPADEDDVRVALNAGAVDWVAADRLYRIGPAIHSVLSGRSTAAGEPADLLQAVIDSVPDQIFLKDRDARWIRINRAMADQLGLADPADALGQGDQGFFPPAVVAASLADDLSVMATGVPVVDRVSRIGESGNIGQWVRTTKNPLRDPDGRIVGLIGYSRKIASDGADMAALLAAEERYRVLVEQLPAVTYVTAVASNARTLYISPQIERMLGFTPDEWISRPDMWSDLLHPADREHALEANRISNENLSPLSLEYRLLARDGRTVWVRDEAQVVFSGVGAPVRWQGVMVDITDRKTAEDDLRQSQSLFRTFMDNSPTVAFMKDADGRYVYASAPMERMYGISLNGQANLTDDDLFPPETAAQNRANDRRVLAAGQPIEFVETVASPDGITRQWLSLKFPVTDPDGRTFVGGVAIDMTERARLESELRRLAVTDPLTGLPNRALFVDRLDRALVWTRLEQEDIAVLFLDLDQFKHVNDSLGHAAGDRLLAQAAERLAGCLREQDTMARFGGDEFAFLIDGGAVPDYVMTVAGQIIGALRSPFVVDGGEAFVGGSIGIAFAAVGHATSGDLLREADTALYQAKAEGRNRAAVFHPAMNDRAVFRLEQESALRHAVERSELELRFQPVVDLSSGLPQGFEALVRWRHPERGLLAPAEFLALAEETGLIVPVGEWVLEAAFRAAREWPGRTPAEPCRSWR